VTRRVVALPTPDLGEGHITPLPSLQGEGADTATAPPSSPSSEAKRDSLSGTKRAGADQSEGQGQGQGKEEEGGDNRRRNAYEVAIRPPTNVVVARPMAGMKGHTAFLTFAICSDSTKNNVSSATDEEL
jgi:hypothetical protein